MCKNKLVMKVVDTLLGNEIRRQPMRNAHNRVYKKGGFMRFCVVNERIIHITISM